MLFAARKSSSFGSHPLRGGSRITASGRSSFPSSLSAPASSFSTSEASPAKNAAFRIPFRRAFSAASFYQVNRDAAELLYNKAKEIAEFNGNETLLDLFCGVGSIGLSMADAVAEVVGIEVVPDAVRCANENARANGIKNAAFFAGDASDVEQLLAGAERALGKTLVPDAVVLDPPRKGCDEKLLSFLARRGIPKIVYISCNPETLSRDVAILVGKGYGFSEITPVDLFPRTSHVETVILMTKE